MARDEQLTLPERHLGLVQAQEMDAIDAHLDRLADRVAASIDLDAIVRLARSATTSHCDGNANDFGIRPPGQRIALASDVAFSFHYPHLLRHWRSCGAEIVPFSPLADEPPDPSASAVWLPGGYPELYGAQLAAASRFMDGLRHAAGKGAAIHGECGGYMVLGNGLEDAEGKRHAMAGLLSLETSFARRRLHLGYRRARLLADCGLGAGGAIVHGHEFHYASILTEADDPLVECRDASDQMLGERGARRGAVSGSFFHAISGEAE
mgnify:CR=1 FL=1